METITRLRTSFIVHNEETNKKRSKIMEETWKCKEVTALFWEVYFDDYKLWSRVELGFEISLGNTMNYLIPWINILFLNYMLNFHVALKNEDPLGFFQLFTLPIRPCCDLKKKAPNNWDKFIARIFWYKKYIERVRF